MIYHGRQATIFIYVFIFYINFVRRMAYTYKSMQYKNISYYENNEHHGSDVLVDAQHNIKWVKTIMKR